MAEWTCATCGGTNPTGMRFCGHCGVPAERGEGAPPASPSRTRSSDEARIANALRSFVSSQVADRLVESGGRLTEERRLVTALFADLSGFTSLADRLDPDELLEVIDPMIESLSNVVGRYEGYVDKFAGDALLAFFGAPVSHEDDAERALRVALEMHDELSRLRGQVPVDVDDLALHVGVNSGRVIARILGSDVRMDYSVLGDAVILAQRLESAAPAGQTYVGETTYRLTRGRFEFERVGELTLKGKAQPVLAWRLVGRTATWRPVSDGTPGPHIVGRERESADIERTEARLSDGKGRVVAVVGEPGVGKTLLTQQAWLSARNAGIRWFESRGVSYGTALAYRPVAELIRRANGVSDDDPPEKAAVGIRTALTRIGAGDAAPYFLRLLGLPVDPGAEAATLEPDAFRRALHDAFFRVIRAVAARGPVAVAVEDLHWCDASTIEFLRQLAGLVQDIPMLLYMTARPSGREVVETVLAGAPEGRREVLELGALDADGTRSLVEGMLSDRPAPALVGAIFERTGGNPFFVQELTRELRDTGMLELTPVGWSAREDIERVVLPPTLEELLAARIDRLSRPAAALLGTAAVIGRRIPGPLVRAVAEGDVDRDLDELVRAGFLDPGDDAGEPTLVFHHALLQDVAYGRLLKRQRRDLHLRVAESAEAIYGAADDVVELLARHLYLADAGSKAVEYLGRAGDRARGLFANTEAIHDFGRAVEVSRRESDARLPSLLLSLAELEELVGDYEHSLEHYGEVAHAGGDAQAWRGMASSLRRRGAYEEALAVLERAFASADLVEDDLRPLWLERGWNLSMQGRLEEALEALSVGLASSAADASRARLLLETARIEADLGRLDTALRHGLEARSIFTAAGDDRGRATALRVIGGVEEAAGRLDEAAVVLREGLALAERVGSIEEIGGCLINLGLVELERDAVSEAIECDRRAIELFERIGHGSGRATGYANLGEKLLHRGDLEQAALMCERAIELAEEIGHRVTVADALQTLAAVRLRQGKLAEAASLATRAADLYLGSGAPGWSAEALALAAEARRASGDEVSARELLSRAEALSLP